MRTTKAKRQHYVAATKYTDEQLERYRLADLLNDARASLRYARELAGGANPLHYGCTQAEYIASAAQSRAEVRLARGN